MNIGNDWLRTSVESIKGVTVQAAHICWYNIRYRGSAPSPYKLIYIDPSDVNWMLVPRYIVPTKGGTYVLDGNWDSRYTTDALHYLGSHEGYRDHRNSKLISIDNFTFYKSLENRFVKGHPWEETELFSVLLEQYAKPGSRWGPSSETILSRLTKLDMLYEDMKQNGYFTQRQLKSREDAPFSVTESIIPIKHEVTVNIGRDGEIIFSTGRHRFCIARILGIDNIPVRVHVRHKKWQCLRHSIHVKDKGEWDCTEKSHLTHPDMEDII